MSYRFQSLKEILDIFHDGEILGPTQISEKLGKSKVIVHKYLKELIIQQKVEKVGKGPQTKYRRIIIGNIKREEKEKEKRIQKYNPPFQTKEIFNKSFLKFTPDGNIWEGFDGFLEWCDVRKLHIEEKIRNYLSIHHSIKSNQNQYGLLEVQNAFKKDFTSNYLNTVWYADQYNWGEFGRGKLAELTFYGKQSQNKALIDQSIQEVFPKLECLISQANYSAIAITPWSLERRNQYLKILGKKLEIFGIPFINIIKYYPNDIPIPQKTLKTKAQRIKNARNTIFIDDQNIKNYSKVLLIDDFVGSGATLNETAAKLKQEGVMQVDGFAVVGNTELKHEVICEI